MVCTTVVTFKYIRSLIFNKKFNLEFIFITNFKLKVYGYISFLLETAADDQNTNINQTEITEITVEQEPEYKVVLRWRNIIAFIYLHIFSVYALFDLPRCWTTYLYQFALAVFIG